MNRLLDHLERHALLALEKQDKFYRWAGEHLVEVDIAAGVIRMGQDRAVPVQVLGTQSDNTLTWLWAWSEQQAEIPDGLIRTALILKSWGEQNGVSEFTAPEIDLERADGTMLALISIEIAAASCFYRESYDGGALFLLLFDARITAQPDWDRGQLVQGLSGLVENHAVSARRALLAYLAAKGAAIRENGTAIEFSLASGEYVTILFDEQGRLVKDD